MEYTFRLADSCLPYSRVPRSSSCVVSVLLVPLAFHKEHRVGKRTLIIIMLGAVCTLTECILVHVIPYHRHLQLQSRHEQERKMQLWLESQVPSLPDISLQQFDLQELPGLTLHLFQLTLANLKASVSITISILRCYVVQDKIQTICNSSSTACFLCKGHEVQA